jgi:hypothetical protein
MTFAPAATSSRIAPRRLPTSKGDVVHPRPSPGEEAAIGVDRLVEVLDGDRHVMERADLHSTILTAARDRAADASPTAIS